MLEMRHLGLFALAKLLLCAALAFQATSAALLTEKQKRDGSAILDYLIKGPGKGETYNWLARFTDKFGDRYAAGPVYEVAADYLIKQLKEAGFDRVYTEDAPGIPNWFRGQDPDNPDQAVLLKPRRHVMPILALGNSSATPPNGIQAKVVVVRSLEELKAIPDSSVRGKIVVSNCPWLGYYHTSVGCRTQSATIAAKRGAVAVLVRSVTPVSLYTLHTGMQYYAVDDPSLQIPIASITVEDADMLDRLQAAGHDLEMSLRISSTYRGTVTRRNIIAEINGSSFSDEMVLFGGHLDSWDVGVGAQDDGGGVSITLHALLTLKALGLRPKRTLRAIFWAAEEEGYVGSGAYYAAHKNESDKISLAMESDSGAFYPAGFHFNGNEATRKILQEIADTVFSPINATLMETTAVIPGDVEQFYENDGVPAIELRIREWSDHYFWYHHTYADMMTLLKPEDMDACAAVYGAMAYLVADLDEMLPHEKK